VKIGQPLKITGRLSPAISDAYISLKYSYLNEDEVIHQLKTGADGSFTDSYTPLKTGITRVTASFSGDSDYAEATKEVSISVEKIGVNLTLRLDKTQVTCGNVVQVSGYTEPVFQSTAISLRYVSDGGSRVERSVLTDQAGQFTDTLNIGEADHWKVTAEIPESGSTLGASASQEFIVLKIQPLISLKLDKSGYSQGESVTVFGTVEPDSVLPVTIKLRYLSKGSTHYKDILLTSDASFKDQFTLSEAGEWALSAELVENERVKASQTEIKFTVVSGGIPIPTSYILTGIAIAIIMLQIKRK
jgi:hypothetical protein